jgi:hypothetical protein
MKWGIAVLLVFLTACYCSLAFMAATVEIEKVYKEQIDNKDLEVDTASFKVRTALTRTCLYFLERSLTSYLYIDNVYETQDIVYALPACEKLIEGIGKQAPNDDASVLIGEVAFLYAGVKETINDITHTQMKIHDLALDGDGFIIGSLTPPEEKWDIKEDQKLLVLELRKFIRLMDSYLAEAAS